MKTIYLIRHSGPFVEIENYDKEKWDDFNRNMILSSIGEEKAKKLCNINELHNIKDIYSSASARAIATIKYLVEYNNSNLKVDNRINEREFGIEYLSDLPDNFVLNQFNNKDLKYKNGESLNEVSKRFNSFINEFLDSDCDKCILCVHGIVLMNYLSEFCDFEFDGNNFNLSFNNNSIINGKMSNPDIYKVIYDKNKVVNIRRIEI